MSNTAQDYPDIGDLLARKAEWRRKQAALPFAEKLDIVDRLRDEAAALADNRADRHRARSSAPPK